MGRAFEIGETEATLAAFVDVMGYVPDGTSACGPECPAAGVSIFEAMEYANRSSDRAGLERCYELIDCDFETFTMPQGGASYRSWVCATSRLQGLDCSGYRLPTAGEWELAARAGSPYCFDLGPAPVIIQCDLPAPWIGDLTAYCGTAHVEYRPCVVEMLGGRDGADACLGPLPVRSKLPNAFGLYGVHGNVIEWVQHVGPSIPYTEEKRWQPPFSIVHDDAETALEIRHDDVAYPRGGAYWWDGSGTCAWTVESYVQHAALIETQSTGFRLARTLPDGQ